MTRIFDEREKERERERDQTQSYLGSRKEERNGEMGIRHGKSMKPFVRLRSHVRLWSEK